MNKTKIEWTNYSWNPITGCNHNCWYCYANRLFTRFHKSFKPRFYPKRLNEITKLKKPSKIFCCSVSDLFAPWTKEKWTHAVLKTIEKYPQHEFQLLTKNPERIALFSIPKHCWVGVTCNTKEDYKKAMKYLPYVNCKVRFLSFEPLLAEIGKLKLKGIDWIIIGKLTGSKKIKLQEEWVENIIKQARSNQIPIFVKNNVNWKKKIQQFPKIK